jgi:capsular exopolysaccharide synthesis family protein
VKLHDHLLLLRSAWWIVLATTLAGVTVATAITVTAPRVFQSSTELFVSVSGATTATAQDVAQGSTAAQHKAKGYAEVATSSRVLDPVIRELGLDCTAAELARAMTVTTGTTSVTLTISVRDTDAGRASTTADAVAASLRRFATTKLDPAPDGQPSLVGIEVLEPATDAGSPVSPRPLENLGLGVALGGLLGYGAVYLRRLLDTKVRGRRSIDETVDCPVLGTILHDASASTRPLTVRVEPRGAKAEAYRALRTSIQFVGTGRPAHVIGVSSAMPGEGKTTTSANLAVAFAETGARVALVDADLRRPRIAAVMGLEGAVGLSDVLVGRADLDDVAQPWGGLPLDVVPAGRIPPNSSELLGSTSMDALLDHLRGRYDYVVLDAPPLLPVTDAAVLSRLTDGTLVVAATARTRKTQLADAVGTLHQIGSRVLGVVLTMQPSKDAGAYETGRAHTRDALPTVETSPRRRARARARARA